MQTPFLAAARFGSREPRSEIQWTPTEEELVEKALALTGAQKLALTWDEALGFVLPNDLGELRKFKRLQESGRLSPWEVVVDIRNAEAPLDRVIVLAEPNLLTAS